MLKLRHSVIIQMNEAISIFYHKWLDIDTEQELFRYLIMSLIGKQRNTWDIDLVKLCHLTDPECIMRIVGGDLVKCLCQIYCSSMPISDC